MDKFIRIAVMSLVLGASALAANAEPELGNGTSDSSGRIQGISGSANDNIVGSKDTQLGSIVLSNPAGALYSPGASYAQQGNASVTAVPEPGMLYLAALGFGVLLLGMRAKS